MLKILIVDDEQEFRELLCSSFESNGYQVFQAANGKEAQGILFVQPINLVISDIRMPVMSGIELLHFVSTTKEIPIILMTGFSDILETQEAYSLGAKEFIAKPFKNQELVELVAKILNVSPTKPKEAAPQNLDLDSQFCKIGIRDFTSGSKVLTDVYIRLSATKYLKLVHKGQVLDRERIPAYEAKGLQHFYIRTEVFGEYVNFNVKLTKAAATSTIISKNQKFQLLKSATDAVLEKTFVTGIDAESYKNAQSAVEATMGVISEDQDLFSLIDLLNSHSNSTFAHSFGVSIYSAAIARHTGWTSSANIFKVSLGALLHDIGKKELPATLLEKSRKDYSLEDTQLYESHTRRGREILSQIPTIPDEVILIALQHHENIMGGGFPSGQKKDQITPLARLVAVANAFCDLALKSAYSPGLPAKQAFERLLLLKGSELDPVFLMALMNLYKHPIPAEFDKFNKKLHAL